MDNESEEQPESALVRQENQLLASESVAREYPVSSPQTDKLLPGAASGVSAAEDLTPLLRDPDGVFGGVALGAAIRYGFDVSLVRLGMVAGAFTGIGILLYFAAWVIIPKAARSDVAGSAYYDAPSSSLLLGLKRGGGLKYVSALAVVAGGGLGVFKFITEIIY